jgi:hypothetical protein
MWTLLEQSDFGLGTQSWTRYETSSGLLYMRNIKKCIEFLLGHLPFAEKLVWEPEKLFECNGYRVYNEMNSGEWWWEMQVSLSP